MRKLLFLMAFVAIAFTGFANETGKGEKTTKTDNIKTLKESKTGKKINLQKEMDCYPVQINASCGSFFETMCSSEESTPTQRQEGFEVLSEMYDKAICGDK